MQPSPDSEGKGPNDSSGEIASGLSLQVRANAASACTVLQTHMHMLTLAPAVAGSSARSAMMQLLCTAVLG